MYVYNFSSDGLKCIHEYKCTFKLPMICKVYESCVEAMQSYQVRYGSFLDSIHYSAQAQAQFTTTVE